MSTTISLKMAQFSVAALQAFTVGAGIYLARRHIVDVMAIEGSSMSPTLNVSGDVVLIDRLTGFRDYRPGDIVICRSPLDPKKLLCKRVTAIAGEYITVQSQNHPLAPISQDHVLIPFGHAWISGDNPQTSEDSSTFGPTPVGLFEGRVVARVYPFNQMKCFGSFVPPGIRSLSTFSWITNFGKRDKTTWD